MVRSVIAPRDAAEERVRQSDLPDHTGLALCSCQLAYTCLRAVEEEEEGLYCRTRTVQSISKPSLTYYSLPRLLTDDNQGDCRCKCARVTFVQECSATPLQVKVTECSGSKLLSTARGRWLGELSVKVEKLSRRCSNTLVQ